jgi:hypothetical protein
MGSTIRIIGCLAPAALVTGVIFGAHPISNAEPKTPEEIFLDCIISARGFVTCCFEAGGTLTGDAADPICRFPEKSPDTGQPPAPAGTKPGVVVPRVPGDSMSPR